MATNELSSLKIDRNGNVAKKHGNNK